MKELVYNQVQGYKIYQYLLILSPPEDLKNKIMELKRNFYNNYRADNALWGKPHITLVKFVQFEKAEERIANRLHHIAMGCCPVKIELHDFGSFPSHTIYIHVAGKLQVQKLVKQIRIEAQSLMKINNEYKPYFVLEPHLSVARMLSPWQYEKGWKEYRSKHFQSSFIADGMLLLKRALGDLKYQIAYRFEFQNLPVSITQGNLFVTSR